jgi:hypothetical protein
MRKLLITSLFAGLAFALPLLATASAQAGIADCGNMNVSAQATCTAEMDPVTCEGKCDGVSFQASCQGSCDVKLPSCTGSCQGTCEGTCSANPGNFDCSVDCNAKCDSDCSGQCSSSGGTSECQGQCKATCSGQCTSSCSGTPPSATCNAKCQGSCSGACKGGHATCEGTCTAEFKANCHVKCKGGQGAVFCDGSYVDDGGHMQSCIDALKAIGAKVDVHASAECSGNECTAEAGASCGGHVVPVAHNEWALALGLGGALGAFGMMRRRRNRK